MEIVLYLVLVISRLVTSSCASKKREYDTCCRISCPTSLQHETRSDKEQGNKCKL